MNRTDRLLAIVLELQATGGRRAEDLAATFETSRRTIYRDVQALTEAGVPLVSIPGQGYSLIEGYFLPPLSFSAEEATMLLLGGNFIADHFDAQYRLAAMSAVRKIEAVLPQTQRDEVRYLQDNILFVPDGAMSDPAHQEMMVQLRRAVIERRRVCVCYRARAGTNSTLTTRDVDPYRLIFMSGAWYMEGYCHLRRAVRNFRLSRIEHLALLEQTFERTHELGNQSHDGLESRRVIVRVVFDTEVEPWVRESQFFFVVGASPTAEGLEVTLAVRQVEDALPWLLSWGAHVRVLEPESLRERIMAEVESVRLMYQDRSATQVRGDEPVAPATDRTLSQ